MNANDFDAAGAAVQYYLPTSDIGVYADMGDEWTVLVSANARGVKVIAAREGGDPWSDATEPVETAHIPWAEFPRWKDRYGMSPNEVIKTAARYLIGPHYPQIEGPARGGWVNLNPPE